MSKKMCMVVKLMSSACCRTIKSRSCLHKPTLLSMAPSCLSAVGLPMVHRRAYSLDPHSSASGRTTPGSFSQQHSVERTSPSSALTHRHLSAAAVQVGRKYKLVGKSRMHIYLFTNPVFRASVVCAGMTS